MPQTAVEPAVFSMVPPGAGYGGYPVPVGGYPIAAGMAPVTWGPGPLPGAAAYPFPMGMGPQGQPIYMPGQPGQGQQPGLPVPPFQSAAPAPVSMPPQAV